MAIFIGLGAGVVGAAIFIGLPFGKPCADGVEDHGMSAADDDVH